MIKAIKTPKDINPKILPATCRIIRQVSLVLTRPVSQKHLAEAAIPTANAKKKVNEGDIRRVSATAPGEKTRFQAR
jgi:hypothetical protein